MRSLRSEFHRKTVFWGLVSERVMVWLDLALLMLDLMRTSSKERMFCCWLAAVVFVVIR